MEKNMPYHFQNLFLSPLAFVVLTLLISRFLRVGKSNFYLAAVQNLLGTFLHELAHLLVGFLLGSKPTSFSLWPKKEKDFYIFGSVSHSHLTWYNAIPTALAPFTLLLLLLWANDFLLRMICDWKGTIIYVFCVSIIVNNSIPSRTDFQIALRDWRGIAFYVFIFLIVSQTEILKKIFA